MVIWSRDFLHWNEEAHFQVNNTLLSDKVKLTSEFALQVDSLKNTNRTEKTEYGIKDGVIFNGNTPYVLVHQYDRIPELNKIITQQYKWKK